jgi:hypothetical protein
MQRRTLSELQTADGMTLRFTPLGLGIGYTLTPDGSTEYIQELVGRHDLVPEVPDSLRQIYERLRTAHTYGILEYDLFTVAESLAYLTFEGALRARFVDAYGGTVPFARDGCVEAVAVTRFDDVFKVVRRSGTYSHRTGWKLLGARSRDRVHTSFDGSFPSLLRWARSEGFLGGQRSRAIENKAITELRNWIAHPERYHRCSPVDSARTIGDVAEFINRLWGHRTPGGHLYPGPVERSPRVAARSLDGMTSIILEPDDLLRLHLDPHAEEWRKVNLHHPELWEFSIVLCPVNVGMAFYAHTGGWDRAPFPIDVLWRPGDLAGAAAAWVEHSSAWAGDLVETIDRVFLVRYPTPADEPEFPVAVERANDLDELARAGQWLVAVADVPGDALEHARAVKQKRHKASGECDDCRVHSHGLAPWGEARAVAERIRMERSVVT